MLWIGRALPSACVTSVIGGLGGLIKVEVTVLNAVDSAITLFAFERASADAGLAGQTRARRVDAVDLGLGGLGGLGAGLCPTDSCLALGNFRCPMIAPKPVGF